MPAKINQTVVLWNRRSLRDIDDWDYYVAHDRTRAVAELGEDGLELYDLARVFSSDPFLIAVSLEKPVAQQMIRQWEKEKGLHESAMHKIDVAAARVYRAPAKTEEDGQKD